MKTLIQVNLVSQTDFIQGFTSLLPSPCLFEFIIFDYWLFSLLSGLVRTCRRLEKWDTCRRSSWSAQHGPLVAGQRHYSKQERLIYLVFDDRLHGVQQGFLLLHCRLPYKKEKIMQISNSCQFNCKQCVEYYAQHFKNYTNQKLDNITSVNLVFIVKNTWKCKWQIISLLQYIHRMSLNTPRPDSLPSSVQHSEQKHHRHHRAVRLHSICSASRLLD